jgi:myo-inositol-1-phosphate synthase
MPGVHPYRVTEILDRPIVSALASLHQHLVRALGFDILVNRGGLALDDPNSLASKLDTKGSVLDSILGYKVENLARP